MRHKKELCLSAACFFMAFLCFMTWLRLRQENLAQRVAPEILRFHVLANSNSRRDQSIKLAVKDFLLEELNQPGVQAESKSALCAYVTKHHSRLEQKAEAFMASAGYSYPVRISVTQCYFPTKSYGDLTLPCGTYDTIQVRLGEARGRNWWCMIYPRLCFLDVSHAAVPDSSKEELRRLLQEEDFDALLDKRGSNIQIRFRLLPFLNPDPESPPQPSDNSP